MFSQIEISQVDDFEFDLTEFGLRDYFFVIDSEMYIHNDIYCYYIDEGFLNSDSLILFEEIGLNQLEITSELKDELKSLISLYKK